MTEIKPQCRALPAETKLSRENLHLRLLPSVLWLTKVELRSSLAPEDLALEPALCYNSMKKTLRWPQQSEEEQSVNKLISCRFPQWCTASSANTLIRTDTNRETESFLLINSTNLPQTHFDWSLLFWKVLSKRLWLLINPGHTEGNTTSNILRNLKEAHCSAKKTHKNFAFVKGLLNCQRL